MFFKVVAEAEDYLHVMITPVHWRNLVPALIPSVYGSSVCVKLDTKNTKEDVYQIVSNRKALCLLVQNILRLC